MALRWRKGTVHYMKNDAHYVLRDSRTGRDVGWAWPSQWAASADGRAVIRGVADSVVEAKERARAALRAGAAVGDR